MGRSKWTLMLVPLENERVRMVKLSRSAVGMGMSAYLVLPLLCGTLAVGFLIRRGQHFSAQRFARENVVLAAKVDSMRTAVGALSSALDTISRSGQSLPLPPSDADLAAHSRLAALTRRARLLDNHATEAVTMLKRNSSELEAVPSIFPADGPLSSLFSSGRFHPVLRITRPHEGIDIAAPVGEPIHAPARGIVTFAGHRGGGYGNMVQIDHGNGYVTRFAHCSRVLVEKGDTVQRGDVIARVGSTGLTTGPHLHYEVLVNGKQVDPLNFVMAAVIPDD